MDLKLQPLLPPRVVAIATDKYMTPTHALVDVNLPVPYVPHDGQGITFSTGRLAPSGHNVGKAEVDLKPKMEKLLTIFAAGDSSGMARRLFTKFLAKQAAVSYFDDADLNRAAAAHANIEYFCNAAMSAPGTPYPSPGKTRIHQSLKQSNWDINKLQVPNDLGVPAFNKGSKVWHTEDFDNGLGLMINGVQHVYVVATHYVYDPEEGKYAIGLQCRFYDVFGLDDEDLRRFGEKSDGAFASAAGVGIMAWWQLQHQYGYAPLVTRIMLDRTFVVQAV